MITAVELRVQRVARHCNPLRGTPWGRAVTRRDVARALREQRLVAQPGTDDHAGRIAYFVVHGSADPIHIDVGVPALGCHVDWLVEDGNHRLAAAIYARRRLIVASVGGQLDHARRLFGVDCKEEPAAASGGGISRLGGVVHSTGTSS